MKKFLLFVPFLAPSLLVAQNNARMLGTPNSQTGTTYTFVAADTTRIVTFNNANPVAVTLPNGATFGFGAGTMLSVVNIGAGTVTITCTSCMITASGATSATLALASGAGVDIYGGYGSPAVNYVALPSPAGANVPLLSANNAFTGNNTHSGTETFASVNKTIYVDGVTYLTVQAAINALPVSGGTVSIPPGTYVGPTSIPNSNTSLICQTWLGCTLTYTTAQTLGQSGSALDNIKLDGLIFDFGSNNGGLTLQNFRGSYIALQVQNTGTAAGLTFLAPTSSINLNFMRNYIPWIKVANAGSGFVLNGDANIAACGGAQGAGGAVFDNTFGRIYLTNITNSYGMQFTSGTDSMDFQQVFIDLAAGNTTSPAIIFNSRCGSQAGDVGLLYFSHLTAEFTGTLASYTGNLIVVNNAIVKFGQITASNVGNAHVVLDDPNGFITGIWDDASPFSLSVPYSASNRPIVQQTFIPATAGANQYAPILQWASQMWNGSASVGSSWLISPSAQANGVPTFDSLVFQNIGTPNSNGYSGLGVQIPNRLIIAGPTGIQGLLTHANTAQRTYTFPDASGVIAQEITATSSAFATATTAGTCVQNTTAVTGATTGMAVIVSPVSTPGVGAQWSAFVSSAGNVTINECAVATSAGGTIAFNIRVIP